MADNDPVIRIRAKDETAAGLRSVKQNLQNVTSAVGVIQGPLNGLTGRMSYFNTIVGKVGVNTAIFGASLAALTKVMYDAFQVSTEAEVQLYKIEAVLKATGYAAGISSKGLEDMAAKLNESTLSSINQIREAQAVLLTYRTVIGDTFERALKYSQDMVAVFGGDLKSSANQLGKALENPTNGISALADKGITFTNSEKEMVKAMQEAGDLAGAQEIIFKKLESQIGGAGEGAAKGTAGAIDKLTNSWNSMLEALGKSVYGKAVDEFFLAMANGLNAIKRSIEGPGIDEQIESIVRKIQDLKIERDSLNADNAEDITNIAQIEKEILHQRIAIQLLVEKKTAENDYQYALDQVAIATKLNSEAEIKAEIAKKKAIEDYNTLLENRLAINKAIDEEQKETDRIAAARLEFSTELIGTEQQQATLRFIKKKQEIESLYGLTVESQKLTEAAYKNHIDELNRIDEERAEKERNIKLNNAQNIATVIGNLGQLALGQSNKNFAVYKNLMRAETYISTIASAQAAYYSTLKYGGSVFAASFAAASAISAGLLRLQQINSTSLGGAKSGIASGGGAGSASQGFQPVSTSAIGRNQTTTVNIYVEGKKEPISLAINGLVEAINNDKLVLQTQTGRERIIIA